MATHILSQNASNLYDSAHLSADEVEHINQLIAQIPTDQEQLYQDLKADLTQYTFYNSIRELYEKAKAVKLKLGLPIDETAATLQRMNKRLQLAANKLRKVWHKNHAR